MRPLIAFVCALSLAACAADTDKKRHKLTAKPDAAVAAEPDFRPPLPEPRPKVAGSTPRTKSAPKQAAAVHGIDVEALSGADRQSVRTILGPADEVREQPPGEVWIYRERECSVELYLFPQISASQFAVLGHKILPSSLGDEERRSCLTRLASRTRAS